jgi:NCS1 family nucleobase:cation symporter-1
VATLAMNVAANVVAPANDFANLAPSKIDFKRGGTLTAIIGLFIMPWKLIADPSGYIFTWLVGYSALLGPVAGILLADYFLVRHSHVVVEDLYRRQGLYTYRNGYNPIALIALGAGVLPNLPGFLTQIKVLNSAAVPDFFNQLYHYAWFVGLAVSAVVYVALMKPQPKSLATVQPLPEPIEIVEIANAGD